ncbi:helix-turn-helix domain-containing protein [Streptomyces sp. FR-108]|uniref:helix-turn-helix domain-containing protein n=1 Tax=Streptomyces sp. FR-108 TaxID=3416665 RepID=UPI003CF1E5D0
MTRAVPSPAGARLAVVLRQLKERTGLSLAQLANVTTFSKSSWERYLNGKSLPPRSAVTELCRLVGEPADHPLALLEIARTHRPQVTHGTQGTHVTPQPEDGAPTRGTPARRSTGARTDTPTPDRTTASAGNGGNETAPDSTRPAGHRPVTVLTALMSVCAVAIGTLVLVNLPSSHRKQPSPSPTPSPATGALCRHDSCRDKDPIVMKCAAEPTTLAEHETATGAWLQIRYSPECGASWARMWGAVVDDRIELRTGGRDGSLHRARVTSRDEADTYVHTLMSVVGPGTAVRACFTPAAGGPRECVRTSPDRTVEPLPDG